MSEISLAMWIKKKKRWQSTDLEKEWERIASDRSKFLDHVLCVGRMKFLL